MGRSMGSCSPERADFVGSQWCGLGRLPHFWCGLGPAEVWGVGCGGGFRRDDVCTPSLGLSVDIDFTATSGLWLSFGLGDSETARGLSQAPVGWGLHRGWVPPVTAWPAHWLRWTVLIVRLPMGSRDLMDPMLNLAVPLPLRGWVIAWSEWHDLISDQYTWAGIVVHFAIPATNF